MKSVFVTGATGFIGGALVKRLSNAGCQVRCLVRPRKKMPAKLELPGLEIIEGNLHDVEAIARGVVDCDTAVHLAGLTKAKSNEELFAANDVGSRNIAAACAKQPNPPTLVYVSSLAASGPTPLGEETRVEGMPAEPISEYGKSKRMGEESVGEFAGEMPISILRPGVVFGPEDTLSFEIFKSIHQYRMHWVPNAAWTPALSLIYSEDLVDLILLAAEKGERISASGVDASEQGVYFACDDRIHPTYWAYGNMIARSMDRSAINIPLPKPIAFLVAWVAQSVAHMQGRVASVNIDKIREACARSWRCSSEKARNQLGFEPTTTIDERLKETSQWYIENGWL